MPGLDTLVVCDSRGIILEKLMESCERVNKVTLTKLASVAKDDLGDPGEKILWRFYYVHFARYFITFNIFFGS